MLALVGFLTLDFLTCFSLAAVTVFLKHICYNKSGLVSKNII